MTSTKIIHLKPNKRCKDGVQDYQDLLLSKLNQFNESKGIPYKLCFLELTLNKLILHRNKKNEQTFIHCQLPMSAWRLNILLPLIILIKLTNRKTKLLITLHEWSNTHPLRRMINYFLLRKAFFVIVPSEEIRKEIQEFKIIRTRKIKIHLIPIGPNIILKDTTQLLHLKGENDQEKIRIGHFGFLYPLKNPTKILLVFNEMIKQNKNLSLVFVGDFLDPQSKEKKNFNKLILELNLRDHIEFRGYLESELSVLNEMNNWDIYISLHENGFSLRHGSTLAALQLGIPVISFEPKNTFSEFEQKWLEIIMKTKNLIFIPKNLSIQEIADVTLQKIKIKNSPQRMSLDWIWSEISRMHFEIYREYISRE